MSRLLPLAAVVVAALVAAAPAAAGVLTPQGEAAGSPNAEAIRTLYVLILVLAAIVFLGVEGALIYSLVKYRARKGAVAAQIHGNTRLEIGWTVGAAVILVFITVFTFIKLPEIKNPPDSGPGGLYAGADGLQYASTDQPLPPSGQALIIRVDGQQYLWRYQYPGDDIFAYEEMVVPEDTTVVLEITADDVAHSWWIPQLGGKMDALPGYVNKTWFKASNPGVYPGQCAELCGRNHANMLARVRVVPVGEYRAWLDDRKQEIEEARRLGAEQRKELEAARPGEAAEGGGAAVAENEPVEDAPEE